MMGSEWQPGDVAMVSVGGREIQCSYYDTDYEKGWFRGAGLASEHYVAVAGEVSARPLVVIDPEDREQVERLMDAFSDEFRGALPNGGNNRYTFLQAALREFANPPPPVEEPTARFAVVLDKGGDEWCHVGEGVWRSLTSTGQFMVEKHWHDNITPLAGNVVRVLSEGVSA